MEGVVDRLEKGEIRVVELEPHQKEALLKHPSGGVRERVKKALAATEREAEGAPRQGATGDLLGDSKGMRDVHALVRRAAGGNATVLVLGESGTGKELVARAIHDTSPRSQKPFVKLNCGALPDNLLESELFGYEKGAFTGAVTRKPGRVELADKGTLFLDEIGDITPQMQVKLLRVLQEKEVERLGGTVTIKVDVRFVAATHRNLPDLVGKGQFREDLFYRLNVLPITLPPLRARADDIAPLARHFAGVHGEANGRRVTLSEAAVARLSREPWPGNVRQLQNLIERIVVLSDGPNIDVADVERQLDAGPGPSVTPQLPANLDAARKETERETIRSALARAGGNRTVAARILGLSRRGLYYKLEEHKL